jgi:hypothetical protein
MDMMMIISPGSHSRTGLLADMAHTGTHARTQHPILTPTCCDAPPQDPADDIGRKGSIARKEGPPARVDTKANNQVQHLVIGGDCCSCRGKV